MNLHDDPTFAQIVCFLRTPLKPNFISVPHKWNHHTMPKPSTAGGAAKSRGFLPKINSKPPPGKAHVTLEVSHGSEKQLIALPAEKLDKNKRYYVTFTVKGSEPPSDNDNATPKSVKSG